MTTELTCLALVVNCSDLPVSMALRRHCLRKRCFSNNVLIRDGRDGLNSTTLRAVVLFLLVDTLLNAD